MYCMRVRQMWGSDETLFFFYKINNAWSWLSDHLLGAKWVWRHLLNQKLTLKTRVRWLPNKALYQKFKTAQEKKSKQNLTSTHLWCIISQTPSEVNSGVDILCVFESSFPGPEQSENVVNMCCHFSLRSILNTCVCNICVVLMRYSHQ